MGFALGYEWFVGIALLKLAIAFLVVFVYLPTKIFPQQPGAALIDRFFDNFVWMTASAIVFVHILAGLNMYTGFSLLLCYATLYVGTRWYQQGTMAFHARLRTAWTQRVALTLDILDRVIDIQAMIRQRVRKGLTSLEPWRASRQELVHALLFTLILGYAAALRFYDVFRSLVFGYSDSYSHLLWMKLLEAGTLYPAGLHQYYPKGFHAFLAVLHVFSGLEETVVVRLAGPLVGVLLVLVAYFAARRLTRNREAALIAMFVFGTFIQGIPFLDGYLTDGVLKFSYGYSTVWFTRQAAPLPEEFALVFLLPSFFAVSAYLMDTRKRSFVLCCLSVFSIFMVHSLIGMALALGLLVMVPLSLVCRVVSWRTFCTIAAGGVTMAILGNLQLIYGWVFGQAVQEAGEAYFTRWLGSVARSSALPVTLEVLISGGLGLLLCGSGLILARGRHQKFIWGFVGLYLLLLAFVGRSMNFGISYLLPPDRVTNYRILVLCVALGGIYYLLLLWPWQGRLPRPRSWLPQAVTVLSLAVLSVIGFPSAVPAPPRYEYEALARITYTIRQHYPPLEWTLVSTVEDYSKAMRTGWHMNVAEFLGRYTPSEANLELPTPYMFLYVEKKLFGASSDRRVMTVSVRHDQQRRLAEWSNVYHLYHENLSIYYEDQDVLVLLISGPQPLKRASRTWQAAGHHGTSSQ